MNDVDILRHNAAAGISRPIPNAQASDVPFPQRRSYWDPEPCRQPFSRPTDADQGAQAPNWDIGAKETLQLRAEDGCWRGERGWHLLTTGPRLQHLAALQFTGAARLSKLLTV